MPVVAFATDPKRKPSDPELHRPVELVEATGKPVGIHHGLPALLASLARATNLDILSDYFAGQHARFEVEPLGERPLWQILNIISEHYCLKWERKGSFLLFRHKEWFEMETQEIPERLLRHWQGRQNERVEAVSFIDVLAALTPTQLDGLRFQFKGASIRVPYTWERWLAMLDPVHRRALIDGRTLQVNDLDRGARDFLLRTIVSPSKQSQPATQVRMRIENHVITMTTEAGSDSAQVRWVLPLKSSLPAPVTLRRKSAP